ncbi:MAG: mismatch-specific DNA-glycosylase [Armatimonadetes bacterium]|nr:mismatch-specific DNA-glycosylase [Armatimonadota bacterium]MDE2207060.1 mismatch-specific DNA-glycosylase [Armatimonadota bacterium]
MSICSDRVDLPDLLPDYLTVGLGVVFVGSAPGMAAAAQGHYYAGTRNRFWSLLHETGFTDRELRPEDDERITRYGIGLTGLMKYIAIHANADLPPPPAADKQKLCDKLATYRPDVICFNGKDVYQMCSGTPASSWGLQRERFADRPAFVVVSTSGRADAWSADRRYLFHELRALVTLPQVDYSATAMR